MKLLFVLVLTSTFGIFSGLPILKPGTTDYTVKLPIIDKTIPTTPEDIYPALEVNGVPYSLPSVSPYVKVTKPIPVVGYDTEIKAYPEAYDDVNAHVIENSDPLKTELPKLQRVKTSGYIKESKTFVQEKLDKLRCQSELYVKPSIRSTLHDSSYIAFPLYQPVNVPDILPEPDPLDPMK